MNLGYRNRKHQKGFTLLEMVIAITILMFIILISTALVRRNLIFRDKLIFQGEFYTTIRLALDIMERDVTLMYTPILMIPPKKKGEAKKPSTEEDQSTAAPGGAEGGVLDPETQALFERESDFWHPATDKTGIRNTRFVGKESELSFITASHQRIYRDRDQSIYSKVIYKLEDDPDPIAEGTKRLVKIENTNTFEMQDDSEDTERVYPLLQGVKSIKFEFYRRDKEDWKRTWDTMKDDVSGGRHPDLVRVTLEVHGPRQIYFEGTFTFRPEMPINGLPHTL